MYTYYTREELYCYQMVLRTSSGGGCLKKRRVNLRFDEVYSEMCSSNQALHEMERQHCICLHVHYKIVSVWIECWPIFKHSPIIYKEGRF